ncbi:MAG: hypothetical protein K0Q49_209 [Haloplasmataceae bacterium]|jgi:multiple sugar transport system permease protein|nr:hypothetical protein [Haloplasmataceae bacterium]
MNKFSTFKTKFNDLRWRMRNYKNDVKSLITNFFDKIYIGRIFKLNFFKGMLYLSPALILILIFTLYPIINSLLMAFYENYTPVDGMIDGFTLDNFKSVLKPGFLVAIKNTALIVFVSVPISVIISLFISVMLNSVKFLKSFFQTIFFLPYVTNTIAIGLVFSLMFDFDYGLINSILEFVGNTFVGDFFDLFGVTISPLHWKDSQATYATAMTTLLIYTIWGSLAFKIMVFTAGLQNIDKQYYDAAKVDGTSKWRIFTKITVPLLSPMIAYITITSFIGAFKSYTTVVALFGETGRTAGSVDLRTIVFYIYGYIMNGNALNPGELSRGAAASLMLFGIILVFTVIQMYVNKKRVHY